MKRASLALAATLASTAFVCSTADAQQTRAQMQNYTNSNITTNSRGTITGAIVNNIISQIISSMGLLADANVWTGSNTFIGPMTLSGLPGCTPGSSIAPVPTGQAFQCSGIILIAQ